MPHSAQMSLYRETFMDGKKLGERRECLREFSTHATRLLYERWIFTILEDFIRGGESGRIARCCIRLGK